MKTPTDNNFLTFGGHLEVLRKMLFRIIIAVITVTVTVFCFKDETFNIILAPHDSNFFTFRVIEKITQLMGFSFHFADYDIKLINTDLSAQFMTHISMSCIVGALIVSPYIVLELFRYITPALYESEKKHSQFFAVVVYSLFIIGVLISYFILFPISFQFLATYQVSEDIVNTITLESYISTFTTLTFMMGIVFQLPVICYVLGKMGLIDAELLGIYRPYALILIMVISAIITPPDLFSLVMVSIPLYGLYEVSIHILRKIK